MLTSAFRALVKNPVKENFYGKKKKKAINVLTTFFIFHKSSIKIFLKGLLTNANECLNNLFKESFNFYKLK